MNKNKKGEMNGVGIVMLAAITLIVGLVLFQVIAQQVGDSTSTKALANVSLGTMSNSTILNVTSCKALSDVRIWNATGGVEMRTDGSGTSNYTVTNNVVYNGALQVSITPNVTVTAGTAYNKGTATLDGTCQEPDYISDAGGRAMASLIVVMFALAILVVSLTPTLREGLMDLVRS